MGSCNNGAVRQSALDSALGTLLADRPMAFRGE